MKIKKERPNLEEWRSQERCWRWGSWKRKEIVYQKNHNESQRKEQNDMKLKPKLLHVLMIWHFLRIRQQKIWSGIDEMEHRDWLAQNQSQYHQYEHQAPYLHHHEGRGENELEKCEHHFHEHKEGWHDWSASHVLFEEHKMGIEEGVDRMCQGENGVCKYKNGLACVEREYLGSGWGRWGCCG